MVSRGLNVGGRRTVYETSYNPEFQTGLWRTAPCLENVCDLPFARDLVESFVSFDDSKDYTVTQATAGTAAVETDAPFAGVLKIDAASTTAGQGPQVQRHRAPFLPDYGGIWAEWELFFDEIDNGNMRFFCGLAALDTTLLSGTSLTTNNHIGWKSLTDDGVLLFSADKAGATDTRACTTVASQTLIRLGLTYDGMAGTIQQWINGVPTGAVIAAANIPAVAVFPSFAVHSGGTDQPVVRCVRYRIFHVRRLTPS